MSHIKNKLTILFLISIFVLGLFLRFYKISSNPPGLLVDEASTGYNSYSILETGKDEYGKSLPLSFRAFGDYKMPVYIYLSTIPIKIFGLDIFSIRFISALAGSLTTIVVYFLIRLIFSEKRVSLALIGTFLFSILPWSIIFSRAAFEANLALFIFLIAFLLQCLAFKRSKPILLFLSALFYAASSYTYIAEKFLSPLFLTVFSLILIKNNKKPGGVGPKVAIFSLILFILFAFPQFLFLKSAAGQSRIKSLSIVKKEDISKLKRNPVYMFRIARNQLSLYSAYFSPRNLFFDPDPETQRSYPELSVFYPWTVIPFFFGLYLLFAREEAYSRNLILAFMFLSPIPASFAGDPFSALRSLPLIFPFLVTISIGIEKIFVLINRRYLFFLVFLFVTVSLFDLIRNSFFLLPKERFLKWDYGYKQVFEGLSSYPEKKILVDDPTGSYYVEYLVFSKYSPEKLQKENKIDLEKYYNLGDWDNSTSLEKIEARRIIWEKDPQEDKYIVATEIGVSREQAEEHFLNKLFSVYGPNGKVVYNVFITDPQKVLEKERLYKLRKLNESRIF